MRGLFIKDCKLLLLQKNFLLLMLVIGFGGMLFTNNMIFSVGLFSFIVTTLTFSTISYDEFDHGYAFLFSLPVTRKEYVLEKYCLGLLFGGTAWLLTTVLCIITTIIKGTPAAVEVIQYSLAIFPPLLIVQAITIPFQLKFGGDKGRIVMLGTIGGAGILILALLKGTKELFGIHLLRLQDNLPSVSAGMLWITTGVVTLLALAISIKISMAIMKKKEF